MKNRYGLKILDTAIIKNALEAYYRNKGQESYQLDLRAMKSTYDKIVRIEANILK